MYKRNGIWYISVGGVRQSSRTALREDAKLLEHKLNKEAWDRRTGLVIPTWDQACLSWLDDNPGLSQKYANLKHMKWWKPHLTGRRLDAITPKLVRGKVSESFPVSLENPVPANATANGYVSFVSRVIRHASILNPKFTYYPKSHGRDRWLAVEEWNQLAAVMPADLRDISLFALATGLRQANNMVCRWSWLKDNDTWALIPPEFTKTAKAYAIPLNRTAQAVIARRRAVAVRHPEFVFLNGGRSWYRLAICKAIRKAVAASGILEVTFHGLRHTFASWLAQRGVDRTIRARLGCWASQGMQDHYSHLDVESLRQYSGLIDEILTPPQLDRRLA